MKKKFSTAWKASKQPRKQRKFIHNAPLHLKHKEMGACLDKVLRKEVGRRSIEIRKGDEVIIMRGRFRKQKGKVNEVQIIKSRVGIEGINRKKKDGSSVAVWFAPSVLKIVSLDRNDKKRFKERIVKKNSDEKKVEKAEKETESKKIKEKK